MLWLYLSLYIIAAIGIVCGANTLQAYAQRPNRLPDSRILSTPPKYKGRRRGKPHTVNTTNYEGKHAKGCWIMLIPAGILGLMGVLSLIGLFYAFPWGVTP